MQNLQFREIKCHVKKQNRLEGKIYLASLGLYSVVFFFFFRGFSWIAKTYAGENVKLKRDF